MKRTILVLFLFFSFLSLLTAKDHNLSGYIMAKANGEPLAFATIVLYTPKQGAKPEVKRATITNDYGFYTLQIPEGSYIVEVSYLGYHPTREEVAINRNTTRNFELEVNPHLGIDSVVVVSERGGGYNTLEVQKLSMAHFSSLPNAFGETDIIKGLQLKTGVKTIGEGTGKMFIRGGNSDQNLIIIDDMPIYNVSHLFGFVSVFNPDAIRSVRFYKGVFPAKYGGRLSSVIDVKQNNGNLYEYKFTGGASLLSTRFTAQGPVSSSSSFIVSARRSLFDLFVRPGNDYAFIPSFYDINAKYNHILSSGGRVQLGVYRGGDAIESADGFRNTWGNTALIGKYQRDLTHSLFLDASVIYSHYNNNVKIKADGRDHSWLSGVNNTIAKLDFEWDLASNLRVDYGASTTLHRYKPGYGTDESTSIPDVNAQEAVLYAESNLSLSPSFGLRTGIRFNTFANFGRGVWFEREEGAYAPVERVNTGGVYNTSRSLEPRVLLEWKPTRSHSAHVGYGRTSQYVHLLENNALGYTSLETWFPVNPNVKHQLADVYTSGWEYNGQVYRASLAVYYKQMMNLIDYIDHARLLYNRHVTDEIRAGKGESYGVEWMLERSVQRHQASVSYNWSRTLKRIEGINQDNWYPASYDMPHDIRANWNYRTRKRMEYSIYWVFTSGRPYTIPVGFMTIQNHNIPIFSARNSARYPDYHRMDIAATLHPKRVQRYMWSLTFAVFNVYARQNPLSYDFHFPRSESIGPLVYRYNFIRTFINISYEFSF